MSQDVKYQVGPNARSLLVTFYVPLATAPMQEHHQLRIDTACQQARALLESARDDVAAELVQAGLCPYCNDLLHPAGERCAG